MFRVIGMTVLALTVCAVTASAQPKAEAVANGTVKGDTATKIDERLSKLADKDFSGVVLVAQGGKIILAKGYGFADRAGKVPYTTDTVFDIGSITKPFTGSAILKLEIDGKLRVTDPITKFFKDVPDDKKDCSATTILPH